MVPSSCKGPTEGSCKGPTVGSWKGPTVLQVTHN